MSGKIPLTEGEVIPRCTRSWGRLEKVFLLEMFDVGARSPCDEHESVRPELFTCLSEHWNKNQFVGATERSSGKLFHLAQVVTFLLPFLSFLVVAVGDTTSFSRTPFFM